MQPTITMDVTPNVIYDPLTNLYAYTVQKFYRYAVELLGRFTLEAEAEIVQVTSTLQLGQFNLTADTNYKSANNPATFNSTFSSNVDNTVTPALSYATNTRSYDSNIGTSIFSVDTPQINSVYTGTTFTLTLSCADGTFEGAAGGYQTGTWSYTGNRTQVNNELGTIKFYPTKDEMGTLELTITLSNGISTASYDATLAHYQVGTFVSNTYTITTDSTWYPTVDEQLYGQIDFFMIGGGGAAENHIAEIGGNGGAGGGAGEALFVQNQPINNSSYSVTTGEGGADLYVYPGTQLYFTDGASAGPNGGATTFYGYTASGGQGGKVSAVPNPSTGYSYDLMPDTTNGTTEVGGSNGSGTYVGGDTGYGSILASGSFSSEYMPTGYSAVAGAGGAGSNGNGGDGYMWQDLVPYGDYYPIGGQGGNGTLCTLNSTTYGYGGNGGSGDTTYANGTPPSPTEYTTAGTGGHGENGNFGGGGGYDGIVVIKTKVA
jgi:hypothetical protein